MLAPQQRPRSARRAVSPPPHPVHQTHRDQLSWWGPRSANIRRVPAEENGARIQGSVVNLSLPSNSISIISDSMKSLSSVRAEPPQPADVYGLAKCIKLPRLLKIDAYFPAALAACSIFYSNPQSQVHTHTRVCKNSLGSSAGRNQKGLSTHETSGLAESVTANTNHKAVEFYVENFHPPE